MRTYIARRVAVVAAAAAIAITGAACTTEGTATKADDTTTSAAPAAAIADDPVMTAEDVFLAVIAERGIPQTQTAIDAGHAVCEALDAGNSLLVVASAASDAYGSTDGAFMVGAAVGAFCPEHDSGADW